MFDQIFGNYLVKTGRITKEQLSDVIESESKVRVKLGLIAVAEKLMTTEQADEVNNLQAIRDRRFGDIAVEKGYLTEAQVGSLLKKQGNIYMIFVQNLIDKGLMTLEQVDEALKIYQDQQGFTHSDMDDLVSGDVDRTVRLFLPSNTELCDKHCGIAIRTFLRIINSGAYVAEIVRAGILAVDKGQMEAGRSLGLNKFQTMRYIIIPQAFKSILPPLGNEFIVLIKETSIIGYIGMMDLTKGAMLIQSRTYNAFWPLMAAAAIYLVIVGILTWGMNKLERRLRTSER